MARPFRDISEDEVKKLAEFGATYEEMAHFFQCDKQTLQNRFLDVIHAGHADAKMSIRRKRMRIAMDDTHKMQTTMLIYLSKVWLGEKEYNYVVNGEGGAPIQVEFVNNDK